MINDPQFNQQKYLIKSVNAFAIRSMVCVYIRINIIIETRIAKDSKSKCR